MSTTQSDVRGEDEGEAPQSGLSQFLTETNPVRVEAAEVEATNQTIRAGAAESTATFPVKLAAKAPPTRAKYTFSCAKPNHVWGRPGLKITCEECNSSFTIIV